jgi:hypothetical protein
VTDESRIGKLESNVQHLRADVTEIESKVTCLLPLAVPETASSFAKAMEATIAPTMSGGERPRQGDEDAAKVH